MEGKPLITGRAEASEARWLFLDRLGRATRTTSDATEVMAITARLLGEYLDATRCAYADVDADNDRFTIRNDWSQHGVPSSAGVYSLDLFGPQATDNLRNGRHLVVDDVDRELGAEGGADMFNAIGIKAIITAPLVKEGRLVAMMAVHQAAPRRWSDIEIALVAEVVDRSWAHIERVRDHAMLREQDRRKDEFLATLAHELRNPLAPLKYAVATLQRVEDPQRRRAAEQVIDRQVSHMARLIDDLLDVSRINRGLIALTREAWPLRDLLLKAVEATEAVVAAARHQLSLQLPGPGVRVHVDAARLVQVVMNLLTNAAKYTPDGGAIRLAAWPEGRQAVIEVTDNGIGIPHGEQGRLFQMFTQLSHSAGRAQGGLGIGLALVKSLVTLHGGTVAVTSAGLDEGTTFTVTLPLAEEPAAALPALQPQAVPGATTSTGRRVLVVDDNDDGRETLVELLGALGYATAAAANGPEAVTIAAGFAPELVLLDLGLPGFDGYEVARRLRAHAATALTHLVALTGWGAERDRARTRDAGFDGHLVKPIEPAALEHYLAQAFAGMAVAGAAPATAR